MRVAVIGAGYAGLSCAYHLINSSTKNVSVTLYEKNSDIGSFACGEIFTSGVYNVPDPPPKCTYSRVAGFQFWCGVNQDTLRVKEVIVPLPGFNRQGVLVDETATPKLWITSRSLMQTHYYDLIHRHGGKVKLGVRASVEDLLDNYDYVVDASGCISQSQKEGIIPSRQYIEQVAQAVFIDAVINAPQSIISNINASKHMLHFNWLDTGAMIGRKGYFWLFPKTVFLSTNMCTSMVNTGIGWALDEDSPRPSIKHVYSMLNRYSVKVKEVVRCGAGILPLERMTRFTYRKGKLFIIGEAAGLMNYALEGGAHLGFASGIIAANAIVNRRGEKWYQKMLKKSGILREVDNSKMLYEAVSQVPPEDLPLVFEAMSERYGFTIFMHSPWKVFALCSIVRTPLRKLLKLHSPVV